MSAVSRGLRFIPGDETMSIRRIGRLTKMPGTKPFLLGGAYAGPVYGPFRPVVRGKGDIGFARAATDVPEPNDQPGYLGSGLSVRSGFGCRVTPGGRDMPGSRHPGMGDPV